MLLGKKIGVGVITCDRLNFLRKLVDSITPCEHMIDHLVVVNDGQEEPSWKLPYGEWLNNETNVNVGESKNRAMRHLLNLDCDYIFTLEDDIIINDTDVFKKYIHAHQVTGLHHFNFGFSQQENLDSDLKPVYRKIIDYGELKLVLTKNILGAFTFYTKHALQTIGLHHVLFDKGHGDHLELTYRAYKHNLGSPFWWFADIHDSWNMIHNQSNFTTDSVVRNNNFQQNFAAARKSFHMLHGHDIFQVPEMTSSQVVEYLKRLKT